MIILTTYKGPGDYPQLNAVRSWRMAFPGHTLLFYTEKECPYTMTQMASTLPHIHTSRLAPPGVTRSGTPILSAMFERSRNTVYADRAMMWINSDIIIGPGAWDVLSPALRCEEPFFMTGQRWDVDINRFLTDAQLSSGSFLTELARSGKLLGPQAADWF